jgi:hypothetical protein
MATKTPAIRVGIIISFNLLFMNEKTGEGKIVHEIKAPPITDRAVKGSIALLE